MKQILSLLLSIFTVVTLSFSSCRSADTIRDNETSNTQESKSTFLSIEEKAPASKNPLTTIEDDSETTKIIEIALTKIFFDKTKQYRPPASKIESIQIGTKFKELVKKIGRPHRAGYVDSILTFEWEASNDEVYLFSIDLSESPDDGYINSLALALNIGIIQTSAQKAKLSDDQISYNYAFLSKHPNEKSSASRLEYAAKAMKIIFYDKNELHKPSEADIRAIPIDTPFIDVIEKLGLPHNSGPWSGTYSIGYTADNGQKFFLVVDPYNITPTQEADAVLFSLLCMTPQEWPY